MIMKLKLMLLLFLDNIGSERELMRIVGTRSKHWRTIKRHIHYDQIQRARSQSRSGWANAIENDACIWKAVSQMLRQITDSSVRGGAVQVRKVSRIGSSVFADDQGKQR